MKKFNLVSPSRLVWFEAGPKPEFMGQNPSGGKEAGDVPDVYAISSVGEYDSFIEEHSDFLLGDVEKYHRFLLSGIDNNVGFDRIKKGIELGSAYLDSKDPKAADIYLGASLDSLKLLVLEINKSGKNEEQKKAVFEYALALLKKASPLLDNPMALAGAYVSLGGDDATKILEYLDSKLKKSYRLSSPEIKWFAKVLTYNHGDLDSRTVEVLEGMVMNSVEGPIDTFPGFKDVLVRVVDYYSVSGNEEMLLLVLGRGKRFLDEDLQTKNWVSDILKRHAEGKASLDELLKKL
ncbi:hypothetical protein HOG17_05480 [Candidatus Peregrinibacteria bacterium]|jgi:hypothetical protein|nr:hypothetical protein [Candidatus Peregrinibacteria bacterium]MBT4148146.1 hypothetical protein [Candidatus Peregrinibacteria bacterium]MBT4366633.1 hypothetical protein [Candidatus Peregrinibacteria bacterium]MBT4455620.1 hypothetical protein [Candidatus Peregrinibacteria bacterium]